MDFNTYIYSLYICSLDKSLFKQSLYYPYIIHGTSHKCTETRHLQDGTQDDTPISTDSTEQ